MWFLMLLFFPIFYAITGAMVKKGSFIGLMAQLIYPIIMIIFIIASV